MRSMYKNQIRAKQENNDTCKSLIHTQQIPGSFLSTHQEPGYEARANCTKKFQTRLEKLQNYGMRVILQLPARTPSSISKAKIEMGDIGAA